MSAQLRASLDWRIDMLTERQARSVLRRLEREEQIRATPAPPEIVAMVRARIANPGPGYTWEEVCEHLGWEFDDTPRLNRSLPVYTF